jgi:hypothetical protein
MPMMELIQHRRSVRLYLDKTVERAEIVKCLEAARLAPSAGNRQPWRFSAGSGFVEIGAAGARDSERYSKRLDCGIAMLHLELGARAAGKTGAWSLLEYPRVARYEIFV